MLEKLKEMFSKDRPKPTREDERLEKTVKEREEYIDRQAKEINALHLELLEHLND